MGLLVAAIAAIIVVIVFALGKFVKAASDNCASDLQGDIERRVHCPS